MDDNVLSWCKQVIRCRSVTDEGTRSIVELCVRDLLAPRGIEARLLPSALEGANQVNLVATVKGRDSGAHPLVLNTHLDTVPPGDAALWTECGRDPFAATISGDRIYGLGAADTKLDFVAKVMALAESRHSGRDIFLIATFGEEHGLVGAKEIVQSGILPRGALAFIGEPSRLEVITAHKGLIVFELTVCFEPISPAASEGGGTRAVFEGRAAHSSTPDLGRNAIRAALEMLANCSQTEVVSIVGGDAVNKVPARCEVLITGDVAAVSGAARISSGESDARALIPKQAIRLLARIITELQDFADRSGPCEPDYAAPTLTFNPGVIQSEPGRITLEFELRPPPALALETVDEGVAQLIDNQRSQFDDLNIDLTRRRANPGFRSALDSETVELAMAALARAELPLNCGVKAGCTEAGIYAAAGLEPIVFGPGPSTGVIHAPNEHNFLAEVEGAIRFYRELIRS